MGARVIVTEVSPLHPLEAVMDGCEVAPAEVAARLGEVFVTVTGNTGVLRAEHFTLMRDGAILGNSGHFNVEIDILALEAMAARRRPAREHVEEFVLPDGRRLFLLAEGRLLNLSAAEGHPAAVMDMSFANEALSAALLASQGAKMEKTVHGVPRAIDEAVAWLKLNIELWREPFQASHVVLTSDCRGPDQRVEVVSPTQAGRHAWWVKLTTSGHY
jgi:adenosylhomocysteinase